MAPIFDYKAFNSGGKTLKGMVEAENQKAARAKLKKQGLMVTEISEKSATKPKTSGGTDRSRKTQGSFSASPTRRERRD